MPDREYSENPFVICKASAGAGKTFRLVSDYLTLALACRDEEVERRFRSILAITFTNKAAGEMKGRILSKLDEIAAYGVDPARSDMGRTVLDGINASPLFAAHPLDEAELKSRAARLRSAVLHGYSDLSVLTIDSFMHRIVRTFAHDLDKPVNFEVMVEQDEMVEQTVERLMSLLGTPGSELLTETVEQFAFSNMEEARSYNVEGRLRELTRELFSEGTERYRESLSRYTLEDYRAMYRRYAEDNRLFLSRLREVGEEAVRLMEGAGLTPEVCNRGTQGFCPWFSNMARGKVVEPNSYTVAVFEAADYSGRTLCKAKCHTPEADAVAGRLRELYHAAAAMLGEPVREYNTRRLMMDNLFEMALLGELDKQLRAWSADNEVVHLSEFNRLINAIVQEEPAPFIYERLGARYRHFLIDEFQDTSVLQWQNLVPLLDNGVSEGHRSLVVGDGKQAIYRFRQGDVDQFVALPRVEGSIHGGSLSRKGAFSVVPLSRNYRTAGEVVRFNNDFFVWAVRERFADNTRACRIYLGDDGTPLGQEALRQEVSPDPAKCDTGHVALEFFEPKHTDEVCAYVLDTVQRLVQRQGYRYKDIMILCRNRKGLACIGRYLLEHSDVPQSSAESFYLTGSHAVMAVVAALRCLHDSADRVAAAELMHRLYTIGIIADNGDEAFLSGDVDLRQALKERGVDFRPDYLLALGLYDCCEELVRQLRLQEVDIPYLASLLNRVAAFAARKGNDRGEFLKWFDDHPDSSAACSEDGDAVRLLTIHKAKGLEAPVVVCVFFESRPRAKALWVDAGQCYAPYEKSLPAVHVTLSKKNSTFFDAVRDAEAQAAAVDDLNILYVALTRPREQLFVVCEGPNNAPLSFGSLLADFAGDRRHFGDEAMRSMSDGKAERERDGVAQSLARISYQDWTSKVQIASPAEQCITPLMEEKRRFGVYAHELLASVRYADDVEPALARFAATHELADGELQRLSELAHQVVSHPDSGRFFQPGLEVKCECELMDGGSLMRPDRVVFGRDETWVVDYKTGQDLGELHDRQVSDYCRAVAAMGYPSVSGWLIYLDSPLRVRPVAG